MARVKKRDHENLSDENIEKVIKLLNPSEGQAISKKAACEILNISYNTTRLNKIIEDYNDRKEYIKLRKSQNRGKAATDAEIAEAVMGYLRGESVAEISKGLYRSTGFVKALLDRVGVPERVSGEAAREVDYIPDACVSEEFLPGEIVWSAKHHTTAVVEKEISVDYQAEKLGFSDVNYENKYSSKCYAIWVYQDIDEEKDMWARVSTGGYSAYALAYDLGKLNHLKKYGVDLSRVAQG